MFLPNNLLLKNSSDSNIDIILNGAKEIASIKPNSTAKVSKSSISIGDTLYSISDNGARSEDYIIKNTDKQVIFGAISGINTIRHTTYSGIPNLEFCNYTEDCHEISYKDKVIGEVGSYSDNCECFVCDNNSGGYSVDEYIKIRNMRTDQSQNIKLLSKNLATISIGTGVYSL